MNSFPYLPPMVELADFKFIQSLLNTQSFKFTGSWPGSTSPAHPNCAAGTSGRTERHWKSSKCSGRQQHVAVRISFKHGSGRRDPAFSSAKLFKGILMVLFTGMIIVTIYKQNFPNQVKRVLEDKEHVFLFTITSINFFDNWWFWSFNVCGTSEKASPASLTKKLFHEN